MRQGTTPKHTFTLPFDTGTVAKVRVTYAQGGVVKVVKKETDCEMFGDVISVRLTQVDTLCFNCKLKTDIQVRVVTRDGEVLASDIITVSTKRCLDHEVL